jgi:hypothetical protein
MSQFYGDFVTGSVGSGLFFAEYYFSGLWYWHSAHHFSLLHPLSIHFLPLIKRIIFFNHSVSVTVICFDFIMGGLLSFSLQHNRLAVREYSNGICAEN